MRSACGPRRRVTGVHVVQEPGLDDLDASTTSRASVSRRDASIGGETSSRDHLGAGPGGGDRELAGPRADLHHPAARTQPVPPQHLHLGRAPASSIRSHRATCAGSRFSRPAPATWSSRHPASTAQPRAAMAAAVVVTRAISGKTRATANSCMTASTLLVASSATTTA